MLRHYLIVAFRGFIRHKLYSAINIAGLAVGIACAILIVLFVRDQISYDRWIPNSANLYRVEVAFHMSGGVPLRMAQAPFPVARAMLDEIPEVKAMTRLVPERMTASVGERKFLETTTVVDPNFFQVIRLPLVAGDPARALTQPESVVISQTIAHKYFGDADPLNKILTMSGANGWSCRPDDDACHSAVHPLTVTGVLRDLPHNSHLVADIVIPNTSQADEIPTESKTEWTSTSGSYGYIELTPGADPAVALGKLPLILDRSINPKLLDGNMRGSEFEEFHLTPFWDVHLTSDNYGAMKPAGSRPAVRGFAVVAALVVILACFNFMNLATARATLRAREISLRKVVGATRRELIVQFLSEALLMALASLLVALALVELLTPAYDRFLNQPIAFHYLSDWQLLFFIVVVVSAAGLLSGIYPALVLSRFTPTAVRNSSAIPYTGGGLIRTALVGLQFTVSIGLGIAALVVFSQINYERHVDLGFQRQGVVVIRGIKKLTSSARDSFARALRSDQDIESVALSNAVPFDLFAASNDSVRLKGESASFDAHIVSISTDFPSVYGMRLIAGRLLSADHGEDLSGRDVLVNMEATHRFGTEPMNIVGKEIDYGGEPLKIIGVLGDAKLDGMRSSVQPAIYVVNPERYVLFSIRVRAMNMTNALANIEKTWHAFAPTAVIQRYFLTDAFDNLFDADKKEGEMFAVFVGVAIFIACLGLFGLAVFSADRRTREIGIRKIFGASWVDIIKLLLWQISIPVLIANVFAWPIAYYFLRHWLEGYAYRISLNVLYFLAAGMVAIVIAWVTVLSHALRLARSSPIHALRYE